ncbi:adaptin N terminal region-domain-containing protein [Catenaria anguillulae PL171]|uniref:Coatomer subunit beta n=1 Tax=Catenaria anguillulae PL171 TaxID=765915 RepID=A0A1Y2HA88_9FUNG|nr:adaptin N terminal region-domain-containing protein [Catenaria anguillulae PL171]
MDAATPCYTIVRQSPDSADSPTVDQLKAQLEKGTDESKVLTMKRILRGMLNGEPYGPNLLMHVIRFVMPSPHKPLKKLLHLFWEIVPKHNPDGKLKQEMILVCNALRNDLQHPNEYIRGASLRMACKLRDQELLEPLVPSCRQNLDHRHPYVRKNAILAVYFVYKHNQILIPDAPKLISDLLAKESDMACRRNAFVMLQNCAPDLAIAYLASAASQIPKFDENVQLAIIDLVRQEARANAQERPRYLKLLHALLASPDASVKYEAASSLTSLTSHPEAVRAAAAAYVSLLNKAADTNVKLIVLERITALVDQHEKVGGDDLPVDLLRVLATPDMQVRRNACKVALQLTNARNVDAVVGVLKKELGKASAEDAGDKAPELRQLLIQTIHTCAIKFPAVAGQVVYLLMDYLGDASNASAVDVVAFVREVVQRFPELRPTIIQRLLAGLNDIKSGKVARGVLWILGEYASEDVASQVIDTVRRSLGEVVTKAMTEGAGAAGPADASTNGTESASSAAGSTTGGNAGAANARGATSTGTGGATPGSHLRISTAGSAASSSNKVLADGSYASQAAITAGAAGAGAGIKSPLASATGRRPPLQALLQNGDYFTGAVLATAVTKLSLRVHAAAAAGKTDAKLANQVTGEAMFLLTCILKQGMASTMDEDAYERIQQCLTSLASAGSAADADTDADVGKVYLDECRAAFARVLAAQDARTAKKDASKAKVTQVEDAIGFGLLKRAAGTDVVGAGDDALDLDSYEADMSRATGAAGGESGGKGTKADNQLSRVVQLTGFSDPVYAEAYVNVHQFDIVLDVLLVNQTATTLQNLTLEFSTLGDLKLVERPLPVTLAAKSYHTLKANIKVSSTETGVIFGNITYDVGALDTRTVNLADIHIDIMDYIHPAQCSETQFRAMWTEFEWENKVNVHFPGTSDLRAYLDHMMATTNMACLTPEPALGGGDCGVLAANLYARSVFGEDALANVCIERGGAGSIVGHIRIRAKTQGIALSLGDKITLAQKNAANAGGVTLGAAGNKPAANGVAAA